MNLPKISLRASRRLRALLACGILLGTGAVGTTALWSTAPATTSGTFTTGFIEIRLNEAADNTAAAEEHFPFAFPGQLLPGDTTAFIVNINNRGSVPFTVQLLARGDSVVGQHLDLTARISIGGSPVTTDGTTCSGGSAAPSTALSTTDQAIVNWTAPWPATPAGYRRVCLQLLLRTSAPGAAAGQAGSVDFTFQATSA
ncbi:hypothetical protein [Gordonia iterans]